MIRIFIFFISLLILPVITESGSRTDSMENTLQDPIIRFGLVSDVQYCNCDPSNDRYYRESLNKLREAVSDFNKDTLNFVISLGDIIDRDQDSYQQVLPILDSSTANVYHVLGNHDFEIEPRKRKQVFTDLRTGPGYYSFDIDAFRFIVVNSNDISTYAIRKGNRIAAKQLIEDINEDEGLNGQIYNGGLGKEQMNWLKNELNESRDLKKKVIIFSHHTLWPESRHNILNSSEITELLDNYTHIIGWFCGHNHQGGYGNYNYVHCVNFKGMVNTPDLNAYAVVEIYNSRIWIKGRGREKGQILAY